MCFSPNKDDIGDKKPLEEFSELLDQIFYTLGNAFKTHDDKNECHKFIKVDH